MIRMDHTHVLTTFHRYKDDCSPSVKQALANTIFMATVISILPLVFVFLFLQRWLVQGIAQTGIKG